jgi:hypothetical protein
VLAWLVIEPAHKEVIAELGAGTPVWVLLMTDDAMGLVTDPPSCAGSPGCRAARAIVIRRGIVDAVAFIKR